jgi:hypothetical protein
MITKPIEGPDKVVNIGEIRTLDCVGRERRYYEVHNS